MIRFFFFLSILWATTPSMFAAPQDARDWAALAEDLFLETETEKAEAETRYDAAPLSPALRVGLQRFGVMSSHLSRDMASYGGATDLACIFRGMAEETDLQLKTLANAETSAARSDALTRLSFMLDDAIHVGEAAARMMETNVPRTDAEEISPGACKAAPFR